MVQWKVDPFETCSQIIRDREYCESVYVSNIIDQQREIVDSEDTILVLTTSHIRFENEAN